MTNDELAKIIADSLNWPGYYDTKDWACLKYKRAAEKVQEALDREGVRD
jgi:hypothetical protein